MNKNTGLSKVIIRTTTPAQNLAALYFLSAKTGLPICSLAEKTAKDLNMTYPYIAVGDGAVAGYASYHYTVEDNPEHVIEFNDLHKFDDFVKTLDNSEASVILNKEYTAIVTTKGIKVGCQTFPISIIKDLQAALDKVTQ
jgi:hypothetical protein